MCATPLLAQQPPEATAPRKDRAVTRVLPVKNEGVKSNVHPLVPVLKWAEEGRPEIVKIKDYTAIMKKQENINGEVKEAQMMDVKIRHEPFSVYLKFRYPAKLVGQEVIYVKGQNEGNMFAHGVGFQSRFGTVKLDPEGFIAMRDNKYPITEIGVLNLVDKLVEVGKKDLKYGECNVEYFENVGVNDRQCTIIQVMHPVPRKNFIFYVARIFVDNELNVPIRYESYDWPEEGKDPMLIEIYTYEKLKLNVGLTDEDFSIKNSDYGFKESASK